MKWFPYKQSMSADLQLTYPGESENSLFNRLRQILVSIMAAYELAI